MVFADIIGGIAQQNAEEISMTHNSAIRLEQWSLHEYDIDVTPYMAPEQIQAKKKLSGQVYGHPRFDDGDVVTTSSLVLLDLQAKRAVTKSGTEYVLGEMDPQYAQYVQSLKKEPYATPQE